MVMFVFFFSFQIGVALIVQFIAHYQCSKTSLASDIFVFSFFVVFLIYSSCLCEGLLKSH